LGNKKRENPHKVEKEQKLKNIKKKAKQRAFEFGK